MITQETISQRARRRVVLVLLAMAVMASLLVALAAKPAHASTTFTVDTEQESDDTNPGDGVCSGNLDPGGRQVCPLRAAI
jgi:hypothetical protein